MDVRWLGWAGVEVEHGGETLVIDPLADPAGTFAALGDAARDVELPQVVPARGDATGGPGEPPAPRPHRCRRAGGRARARCGGASPRPRRGGEPGARAGRARARRRRLPRRAVATWESVTLGPFTCTALPAVDGLGDPQVSWLVEADGTRVLHLGDTVFHGAWWQMARRAGPFDVVFAPVNGAVVDFPHQQPPSPLPAAMEPEQAALAGELLGAGTVVPMHYGGFALEPHYVPIRRRARALRACRPGPALPLGARGARRRALMCQSHAAPQPSLFRNEPDGNTEAPAADTRSASQWSDVTTWMVSGAESSATMRAISKSAASGPRFRACAISITVERSGGRGVFRRRP